MDAVTKPIRGCNTCRSVLHPRMTSWSFHILKNDRFCRVSQHADNLRTPFERGLSDHRSARANYLQFTQLSLLSLARERSWALVARPWSLTSVAMTARMLCTQERMTGERRWAFAQPARRRSCTPISSDTAMPCCGSSKGWTTPTDDSPYRHEPAWLGQASRRHGGWLALRSLRPGDRSDGSSRWLARPHATRVTPTSCASSSTARSVPSETSPFADGSDTTFWQRHLARMQGGAERESTMRFEGEADPVT